MIIKSLTMNNFGVYAGLNTFEFTHSKPVILIGGMNGRGKTTFLEAILLALYGNNSKAYKESRYKTYGQYLKSYVNKSSLSQSSFVEIDFILNEQNTDEYLVRREWNALSKRTSEILTVEQNGQISTFLTQNWPMFIENILPNALSSFYFFDGEKIAELAVDNTDNQMKESIRSMLGINVLDVLRNDLLRVMHRTEKNIKGETAPKELQQARDELAKIAGELDDSAAQIADLTLKISLEKEKIDQLHQQYKIKGGNVIEQRQTLIQKKAEIDIEIEQNANSLIDIASEELPFILVKDLIQNVKLIAEDEHNEFIMRQAVSQIEVLLVEYGSNHKEDIDSNQKFVDFVKKNAQENSIEMIYELSDHALFQVNSLLADVLAKKKEQALLVLAKKSELKEKFDEVDRFLSLDINENVLTALLTKIKKREDSLVVFQVRKSSLEQRQSELHAKQTTKTIEYNHMVESYLAKAELADDAKRSLKYSSMAINIIDKYSTELQKRKTDRLGRTITECYKKLANKKNLIQEIKVDSESLNLTYVDKSGQEVSKTSLSAGEKQLMVIAILWALAICSTKKLPVIIDTPLSRLDSMHRKSVVKNYFPNASDQTIILSTDSEIDHYYYEMMKECVGDEFTLAYNEETQSTTILKGYFQRK